MAKLTADRRLWLDATETRVVEDGDPDAAFLLAGGDGKVIPEDEVERLGLYARGSKIHQKVDFIEAAEEAAEADSDGDLPGDD